MKLIRLLVLCCVVLALPLQGFAAASQMLCHMAASATAHAMPAHEHMLHEAHGAHHEQAHASSASGHDAQHAKSDAGQHQCSSCAQCGAGHAMVSMTLAAVDGPPSQPTLVSRLSPLLSDALPHPLERPPRQILA